MVDPGHMFRRALSWLPDHFVTIDHRLLNAAPRFSSTDHLSVEAVAAYVDGELPMKAHLRAAGHLARCPQCSAEVDAQSQARDALRDCRPVNMPSTLMGLLAARPQSTPEDPAPPAPLADQSEPRAPRVRRKRR